MRSRSLLLAVPSFLVSLGAPAGLNAQEPAQCPPAPSISGSAWEGQTSERRTERYELLVAGALAVTTPGGRFTAATWTQSGECIAFDLNNGAVKFSGRVAGDKLNGEFTPRFGGKWTVVASRQWSGGDSRAGREWELLHNRASEEFNRGFFSEAPKTTERALKSAEDAFGPADERLVLTLRELALELQRNAKHAEALPHAQRVLGIVEKSQGRENRQYCDALNTLGKSYIGLQKYVEAEDVFRKALATSERLFGPSDPLVAVLLQNMGSLLTAQDRYDEAEPFLQRSLKLLDTDKADRQTLAIALNNLALIEHKLGRVDEALMLYERGLGEMERQVGRDHKLLIPILKNLSVLYRAKGWSDEAAETEARIKNLQAKSP